MEVSSKNMKGEREGGREKEGKRGRLRKVNAKGQLYHQTVAETEGNTHK